MKVRTVNNMNVCKVLGAAPSKRPAIVALITIVLEAKVRVWDFIVQSVGRHSRVLRPG